VGAKKKAHLSRKTKPNKCVCLEGVDFGNVGSTFHMLLSLQSLALARLYSNVDIGHAEVHLRKAKHPTRIIILMKS
jgi:hypothetical protein